MSALLGAGISAAGGLLSGLFSGIGANKRLDKSIQAQKEENATARQWNKQMAEWTLRENRKDVADQRQYNDPSQQMARLKNAGLNPDLMYGGGASGLLSGSMASPSSVSPVSPADVGSLIANTPTMAQSMLSGVTAMREMAETQNIQQDTKKKQGESTSITLDNLVKAKTTGAKIDMENMSVTLAKDAHTLNEKNMNLLDQQLINLQTANNDLNASIQQKMAAAKNMDAQTLNQRIQAYFAGPRFANEMKQAAATLQKTHADTSLSLEQQKALVIMTVAKKLNLDANTLLQKANVGKVGQETANLYLQGKNIHLEGKQLELNYNSDTEFKDWERACDMVTKCFNTAAHVIDAIIPF